MCMHLIYAFFKLTHLVILIMDLVSSDFDKEGWLVGASVIWYQDAKNQDVENVLILSGDHLYRMDYMDFVQKHKDSGADVTISCVGMDDSRASDYGLMKINEEGQVLFFKEKPKGAELQAMVQAWFLFTLL
jgi:ADP-glucose pyrophosphorylase